MQYFGKAWNAHIASLEQVPPPVGQKCLWCDEEIIEGDQGLILDGLLLPQHAECFLRQIVGSVGHQSKTCSCYVRGGVEDPVGMSKREAAVLAARRFLSNVY